MKRQMKSMIKSRLPSTFFLVKNSEWEKWLSRSLFFSDDSYGIAFIEDKTAHRAALSMIYKMQASSMNTYDEHAIFFYFVYLT